LITKHKTQISLRLIMTISIIFQQNDSSQKKMIDRHFKMKFKCQIKYQYHEEN
jgi:hypothetical protein